MAEISFKNNPILNDEWTIGGRIFIFDGDGWVPKSDSVISIEQSTGQSTTSVMSQKATTDAIDGHINNTTGAHLASAINLDSGKSLQQAITDGDIGGGSGHAIKDLTTTFAQRDSLKFTGNVTVTDNLANNETVIDLPKSAWNVVYVDSALTKVLTALPWTIYLVTATSSAVTIKLPNVVSENKDEYKIILYQNTHKVIVTSVNGSTSIGGYSSQIIPTVGSILHVKCDGTSGYDIITDTRQMSRVEFLETSREFTDDGFENDVTYICKPNNFEIFITLPAPGTLNVDKSISSRWLLDGTGIVTITAANSTIAGKKYQILIKSGTSFTITLTNNVYYISNDGRDTFFPNLTQYLLNENSTIIDDLSGTYFKQRCLSIDDSRYTEGGSLITSDVSTTYPNLTMLQSSISDDNLLSGIIPSNSAQSCIYGYTTGGPCYFMVKYYKRTELGVETLIGKTHTALFTNTVAEEICLASSFDDFTMTTTDRLVIRTYAAKKNVGDTVTINIYSEGSNGTKTEFAIPVSVNHNDFIGRNILGAHEATVIIADTTNFNKNLTSAENTVQKALDKIDDLLIKNYSDSRSIIGGLNGFKLRYDRPVIISSINVDATKITNILIGKNGATTSTFTLPYTIASGDVIEFPLTNIEPSYTYLTLNGTYND